MRSKPLSTRFTTEFDGASEMKAFCTELVGASAWVGMMMVLVGLKDGLMAPLPCDVKPPPSKIWVVVVP